jgi:hypothetical protein
VLAADLGDGSDGPRATGPGLLRRPLGCLPRWARASEKVALRADAFAGQLARAAHDERIAFAIGAKRIAPLWQLLPASPRRTGTTRSRWTMPRRRWLSTARTGGRRAPGCWSAGSCWTPEQVSADPRSRRRRTLHPDQRALPLPELAQAGAIYAY